MRRRNEKHLAFLRTLPCVICNDPTATEACHVRFSDLRIGKHNPGVGEKPDDRFCLPMCGKHHREQHQGNERAFWKRYGIDPILTALAIYSVSGDADEAELIMKFARDRFDNILAAG
jgi:hypothetical protein